MTNAAEACRWFRLAAQHGIGDPDFDSSLDNGWGVQRDVATAQEILVELASRGHSLAKCMVGRDKWYGRLSGGRSEGLEFVRDAERQGNATAYLCLENLEQTGGL